MHLIHLFNPPYEGQAVEDNLCISTEDANSRKNNFYEQHSDTVHNIRIFTKKRNESQHRTKYNKTCLSIGTSTTRLVQNTTWKERTSINTDDVAESDAGVRLHLHLGARAREIHGSTHATHASSLALAGTPGEKKEATEKNGREDERAYKIARARLLLSR